MERLKRKQVASEYKAALLREGSRIECAACFWAPPAKYPSIVNLHHVVPVQAGGTDEPQNLVLLCPNCHALAHAMFPVAGKRYRGPRERVILLVALREPEVYLAFKKRQAAQILDRKTVDPALRRFAASCRPAEPLR